MFTGRRRDLSVVVAKRGCAMRENPFDSIESAQEYLHLLIAAAASAGTDIQSDAADAVREGAMRRLEALHIVAYKLEQLDQNLRASARILNDLRLLRRVLERGSGAHAEVMPESTRTVI
jgi:hypothetical protein